MLLHVVGAKSSSRGFPWWIVWVWLGILSGVFFWLGKQRSQDHSIQPVKIDLSFLRHPALPVAALARSEEVLVASQTSPLRPAEREPDQPKLEPPCG